MGSRSNQQYSVPRDKHDCASQPNFERLKNLLEYFSLYLRTPLHMYSLLHLIVKASPSKVPPLSTLSLDWMVRCFPSVPGLQRLRWHGPELALVGLLE